MCVCFLVLWYLTIVLHVSRRWLHVTVAGLCVATGGFWVLNNQKEFQAAAKTFRVALQEFFNEHMIEPIQYGTIDT